MISILKKIRIHLLNAKLRLIDRQDVIGSLLRCDRLIAKPGSNRDKSLEDQQTMYGFDFYCKNFLCTIFATSRYIWLMLSEIMHLDRCLGPVKIFGSREISTKIANIHDIQQNYGEMISRLHNSSETNEALII
ncbi:hypothetical protein RF11_00095 [Thelohanellus kitauei]|uniref:Uncharacterized protein n=1 Tax=Thelohanellus kitauei TaxID=669202 RepID=A0A0C2NHJ7_THEKT|nr:hypothetical protein RF11_00095 [Thelohanellus kitauei]